MSYQQLKEHITIFLKERDGVNIEQILREINISPSAAVDTLDRMRKERILGRAVERNPCGF